VELIVIPSLIILPVTTMLLGFGPFDYLLRFGYLLRVVYAMPYLLFINKIEGRIQK